jgi:acyl carrier protein
LRRHAPKRPRLINTYGLTESTIISTVGDLTACPADGLKEVPIGRTIADTELYLLDPALRPVPLGVAGELFIGGGVLARGYHDRQDVTADRFVPHVFSRRPGERLYAQRSGAGAARRLVRVPGPRRPTGEDPRLSHRAGGDRDSAVRHSDLAGVAVAAPEERPGQRWIVAWVVPGARRPTPGELRSFLAESLPEYMLPGLFLFLDALLMTPNGKGDRAALPSTHGLGSESESGEGYTAPRDKTERIVAEIWQEALGVERVGIHDSFFDLGGHSLLLIRVSEAIRERFGRTVPMLDLFKPPDRRRPGTLPGRGAVRRSSALSPRVLEEGREGAASIRVAVGQERFLKADSSWRKPRSQGLIRPRRERQQKMRERHPQVRERRRPWRESHRYGRRGFLLQQAQAR